MALKGQSIRKGVDIYLNGALSTKQQVIELSESWTESQENFFRKMIKQGGTFKVAGVSFEIKVAEQMVTSKGEKDTGVIVYPE
jgi:hypothetical protein